MNDSGKPQRVENLPKMSSNSTFRADDSEASAGLVRDKPRNGALIQSGLMVAPKMVAS